MTTKIKRFNVGSIKQKSQSCKHIVSQICFEPLYFVPARLKKFEAVDEILIGEIQTEDTRLYVC